jgi:iron complex transport system substrate-binding protein
VVSALLAPAELAGDGPAEGTEGVAHQSHRRYRLDEGLARELKPDLVLTQDVCEVCAVPARLAGELAQGMGGAPRLLSLSARTLADVLDNVRRLGLAAGREAEAEGLLSSLRAGFHSLSDAVARSPHRPRVVFLEWLDPPWVGGNWVPELVELAGGFDTLGVAGTRSRRSSWTEVRAVSPEVVFVAPCGVEIDRAIEETSACLKRVDSPLACADVWALDGTLWSRYGPRVAVAAEALAAILHPELFDNAPPLELARQVRPRA